MNGYSNKVRYAVRTIKNPTSAAVHVVQHEPPGELPYITLRPDVDEVAKLDKPRRAMFIGYLRELQQTIEVESGVRVGIEVPGGGIHG